MKFILATKQYMTQLYDGEGRAYPATVLRAGPLTVVQVKSVAQDGYDAVQVGFGSKRNVGKSLKGHLKDLGNFATLREFRGRTPDEKIDAFKTGDAIDVSVFEAGEKVHVAATSKGKGFQGVVKRHGFHGGSRTHGQKHSEREPGSIGGGGRAGGRVVKGMRMAGRMGGERVTVRNLLVLKVDKEKGELVLGGAVPGRRGTLVEVRSA